MIKAAEKLKQIAKKILEAGGSADDEAQIVAEHLVQANLKGHDSHGVGMLVQYIQCLHKGLLKPNTPARLVNDAGAILQFNGDRGYGQRTGREAMAQAIERARTTGVCLVTLAQTNHLGRIGTYGEQAAAAGLMSIHFVNVVDFHPIVAPYCGSEPRFGTNPICIAMPATKENPPFMLDFATSMVAHGKARVAYLAGKKFDENVFLDYHGVPSNDPAVLIEEPYGALVPMAKHKGGGLVVACELLAGLLSGGGTFQPGNERKGGLINNMTAIVIDPAKLAPGQWLGEEYDAMIAYIRSSPQPFPQEHPLMMAGEPERQTMAKRLKDGITISDNEWQAIEQAGISIGVDPQVFKF